VSARLRDAVREQSEAIQEDEGFWRHLFLYRIFGQRVEHSALWGDSTGLRLQAKVQPVCSDCSQNVDTGNFQYIKV